MQKRYILPIIFTFLLLIISNTNKIQAGIFDPGTGGGGIFEGVWKGVEGIFDSLGTLLPGGAIVPGLTTAPTPAGPTPTLPPGVTQPLEASKKIKLSLEWDALSMGGEVVGPLAQDPLSQEHKQFIASYGCPPCEARTTPAPAHSDPPTNAWHYCAEQPGCIVYGDIKHALYGWSGHTPTIIESARTPYGMKQAFEGPNSHTLPHTVSNKYVRRDGYVYYCRRACDGGNCMTDNYMEFQTLIYPSNAISMYLTAENLSIQAIDNVEIKIRGLTSEGPLPHNLDYPLRWPNDYSHGNTLTESTTFSWTVNGLRPRIADDQLVFGPFSILPGEKQIIPLQPSWSEYSQVPSGRTDPLSDTIDTTLTVSTQDFCECAGEKLAGFMNALTNAKASGAIPSNVNISSLAFNISSPTFNCLPQAMKDAGADFGALDVCMGNAYNTGPASYQSISAYVDRLKAQCGDKPIILTEIGMIEIDTAGTPRDQAIEHLREEIVKLQADPQIQAALLFNSFGNNPDFGYNVMSDAEIAYVCGGDCGKIGINSATGYGMGTGFYDRAAGLGMQYTMSIGAGASFDTIVADAQVAIARGLTPVFRIGVGFDSGGLVDPAAYIDFINQLSEALGGADFIVSGGPNEPDFENWLIPECPYESLQDIPVEINVNRILGRGGIIPRDFNFICDSDDSLDSERCGGAGMPHYIIPYGSDKFYLYRDVTGIGGSGYWASSNNSVVGPIEIVAEYGGPSIGEERISRSVILVSIPIGGRLVDNQARPYGWPATGEIEQDWGFTGEAEGAGYYRSNPAQDYGEYRYCGP